jgi:hypothetical protein
MKNIHVLPTDKPSRLWMTKLGNLARCHDIKPIEEELGHNVNIYITSDEEIKERDWCLDENENIVKADKDFIFNCSHEFDEYWKKIILTTDPELIKDGVQSISDEFLEWFVKNPSCEDVEVEKEEYILQHLFKPQEYKFRYKIIIPKEKNCTQNVVDEAMRIVSKDVRQPKCVRDGLVKQETLEDKLKDLVLEWQKRQEHYIDIADKNLDHEHTYRKFTYKAMATRDCWKELLKLIENERRKNT